jgi:hypothetical protein
MLYAIIEQLGRVRNEYASKDEFAVLLEEALRPFAEQPNAERFHKP